MTTTEAAPTTSDGQQRFDADTSTPTAEVPLTDVPFFTVIPRGDRIWAQVLTVAWIATVCYLLDRLTVLLFNYWLLESLELTSVFWTNFRMGAGLFAVAFVAFAAAVIVPALLHRVSGAARGTAVCIGLLVGVLAGYLFSQEYGHFLLLFNVLPFGSTDSVFGNDLAYYIVNLPAYWAAWTMVTYLLVVALISTTAYSHAGTEVPEGSRERTLLSRFLARASGIPTLVVIGLMGVVGAVGCWLGRYDVLIADNYGSAIFNGGQYLDVTGLFSTVTTYWVWAIACLGVAGGVILALIEVRRGILKEEGDEYRRAAGRGIRIAVGFVGLGLAFVCAVMIRDAIDVDPNEPVVQLPYIERHVNATREAWGLEDVETVRFEPRQLGDPMPTPEELLEHPAMKNVPLWPGFVNYIEPLVDPQHSDRVLLTEGDEMIYGPSMEIFQQQQMLRTYYDFLSIDTLRYTVDGEKRVFTSSVRELPLIEPFPWLTWWGQRFFLFTHGHGLVVAPANGITAEGAPEYVTEALPYKTDMEQLQVDSPSIYYGEGSSTLSFTNVRNLKEFDYALDEGRKEVEFPEDVKAGVHIDSLLKKLCIGWRSGQFFEVVFSGLIGRETRVHFYRMPMTRVNQIAPFLYYDPSIFATAADGKIQWIINGMTTTDRYPYSRIHTLGDKAVDRSRWWNRQDFVDVNYVRDSVKVTIDAYTGDVKFYKFADEPIVNTWAGIYPDLFEPKEEMPDSIRAQLQYPIHLFHVQFDDAYIEYHMKDPLTFFNMEDRWDDADEVQGPILDQGKSITFSFEPYHMIVDTRDDPLPEAKDPVQFVMAMPFTSGSAKNLRALPMVYQDGEDYGRIVSLQVPQGQFYLGPEQADSAIDQEPEISEQISWWNRRGTDVIRGHTTMLVLKGEVIYVEPVFIRSQQNPVTQLKKVIVVFRGKARMADTLDEALRLAMDAAASAGKDAPEATAAVEPPADQQVGLTP